MNGEALQLLNANDAEPPREGLFARIDRSLHLREALSAFRSMTRAQVAFMVLLVMLAIVGNAGQVIVINMWTKNFIDNHQQPRPFTIITLSSSTIAAVFCALWLLHVVVKRPKLRFALTWRCVYLTVLIGLTGATNGVFLVYATNLTPEILQALLMSTQIFYTLLFSALFLGEGRSYCQLPVALSFLFSAGGIVVGASASFGGESFSFDKKMWTLIYAASIIPLAFYNIFASLYMRAFTEDPAMVAAAALQEEKTDTSVEQQVLVQSDDTTVKLTMLFWSSFVQFLICLALFPMDSLRWFGSSATVAEAGQALLHGWQCVFDPQECPGNWVFYILMAAFFFLYYAGVSFLTHASPGLSAMVVQLSSPITALILVIVPQLNVQREVYAPGPEVAGAILISIGAVIFTAWEHSTRVAAEAPTTPSAVTSKTDAPEAAPHHLQQHLAHARSREELVYPHVV